MPNNQKTVTTARAVLMVYFIFILFFLFFAFNRSHWAGESDYRYSFHIYHIPLWLPSQLSIRWLISVGNVLAFAPFGALLPMAFPKTFGRFWTAVPAFLLGIGTLEALQTLTKRGSFDLEDILVNTLGFIFGFISWKLSRRVKNPLMGIVIFGFLACFLTFLAILMAEPLNNLLF